MNTDTLGMHQLVAVKPLPREWVPQNRTTRRRAEREQARVERRTRRLRAAQEIRTVHIASEAPEGAVSEAEEQVEALASTVAEDAAPSAPPDSHGGAIPLQGTAQGEGHASGSRDPRLGRFVSLGAFLNRALQQWGWDGSRVREVALLPKRAPAEQLLEYPGGLDALYDACRHIAADEVSARKTAHA